MRFLLDQLQHDRTDEDGTEVYVDEDGRLVLRLDDRSGRAVLVSGELEAVLVRNGHGQWVPEGDQWLRLARALGAPGLAAACFGF